MSRTVRDGNSNPVGVGGAAVVLSVTGSADVSGDGVTETVAGSRLWTARDNGDGTYTATVTNTKAETVTVSATLDGTAVADTATVGFIAGDASAGRTTVEAVPATGVPADGSAFSTVTVTVLDGNDNPVGVGGATVVLSVTGSADVSGDGVTETGAGMADEVAEMFTVSVASSSGNLAGSVTLGDPASVETMITDDDVPVATVSGPSSGSVDEGGTAQYTVTLDRSPAVGVDVTWAVTGGGSPGHAHAVRPAVRAAVPRAPPAADATTGGWRAISAATPAAMPGEPSR